MAFYQSINSSGLVEDQEDKTYKDDTNQQLPMLVESEENSMADGKGTFVQSDDSNMTLQTVHTEMSLENTAMDNVVIASDTSNIKILSSTMGENSGSMSTDPMVTYEVPVPGPDKALADQSDQNLSNVLLSSSIDGNSEYYVVVENPDGTQILSRVLSSDVMLNTGKETLSQDGSLMTESSLTKSSEKIALASQPTSQSFTVILNDSQQMGVSNLLLESNGLESNISHGSSAEMIPLQFSLLDNSSDVVNLKVDTQDEVNKQSSVVSLLNTGPSSSSVYHTSEVIGQASQKFVVGTSPAEKTIRKSVRKGVKLTRVTQPTRKMNKVLVVNKSVPETNDDVHEEESKQFRILEDQQYLIQSHLEHHFHESQKRKAGGVDGESGLGTDEHDSQSEGTFTLLKEKEVFHVSDDIPVLTDLTAKINSTLVKQVAGCHQFLMNLAQTDCGLYVDQEEWTFTGDLPKLVRVHNALKHFLKPKPKSLLVMKCMDVQNKENDKGVNCSLLVPYLSSKGRQPKQSYKYSTMGMVNILDSLRDEEGSEQWTSDDERTKVPAKTKTRHLKHVRKHGRPRRFASGTRSKIVKKDSVATEVSEVSATLLSNDAASNVEQKSEAIESVVDNVESLDTGTLTDPLQKRLREEQLKCKEILNKKQRLMSVEQHQSMVSSVTQGQGQSTKETRPGENSEPNPPVTLQDSLTQTSEILVKRKGRPPKRFDQFVPVHRMKPRNPLTESAATKQQRNYEEQMAFKFFCNQCSFKSKRQSHFLNHLKCHTSGNSKTYTCDHCDFVSISLTMLKRHELTHKKNLFKCDICVAYTTDRKELLQRHIKFKHNGAKPQRYECDQCDFVCSTRRKYENHYQRHVTSKLDMKTVDCGVCEKTFRNRAHLQRHLRDVHGPNLRPHLCDTCGKAFKRTDALQQHKLVHSGRSAQQLRFKCETCDKGFRSAAHLREHQSMHSSERPYLCQYCGASFKTQPVQKKHILTLHIKPRTHVCSVCCRQFNTKHALQRHEAVHNKVDPDNAAAAVLELQINEKKDKPGELATLEGGTLHVGQTTTITVNGQPCLVQDLIGTAALAESVDQTGQSLTQNFIQGTQGAPALYYFTEDLQTIS